MYCCTLLYVHSSIAIILMGKRELIALLNLSSWCLVMVERLFLTVPRGCLQFVIVVFPDHTHLLFLLTSKRLFFINVLCNLSIIFWYLKANLSIFIVFQRLYFLNITFSILNLSLSLVTMTIISIVLFLLRFHIKPARKRDIYAFAFFLYTLASFKLII